MAEKVERVVGSASNDPEFAGLIGNRETFASLNKLITRDLNKNANAPTFYLYTKDDIAKYLSDPYRYEKQLRNAVIYIYGASSHFRRLIQYFVSLTDLSYVVSPYRIDPRSVNVKSINRNYRKVLNVMSAMSVKTQIPKILTVCFREDIFYGTILATNDSITIQQLPSDYCAISSVEGNVLNVTFDFSYFDARQDLLQYYPPEFAKKYRMYQNNRTTRWFELDCPNSFAVKVNNDILAYAIPPFVGILRELYDLEDYKALKLTKTALENYAILSMQLPMDDDGNWGIDLNKAKEFWRNLDGVLPEEVGSILTPMPLQKISFEKSNTGDADTISDAEQNIFTAAGVSSLLFNNEKASANALALSIKVDQAMTYGVVKSIEDVINRYIQSFGYGKYFKVTFLDCSPHNRKELGDAYLKAASYGLPTISMYAASQGLGQAELDCMSFLETQVVGLQDMFIPIQSSTQMSANDSGRRWGNNLESNAPTDEGGRPVSDPTELTDSGEQSSEQKDDWG